MEDKSPWVQCFAPKGPHGKSHLFFVEKEPCQLVYTVPKLIGFSAGKKMNHLQRGADAWLTSGFWTRSIYWTPCHPQPAMRSLMQTFRLFLGQCVHLVFRNQLWEAWCKHSDYFWDSVCSGSKIVFVIFCKEFDPHLLGTVCALVQRWLCLYIQMLSLSSVIMNVTRLFLVQCVSWRWTLKHRLCHLS